jgi:hypothetical protein
LALILLLVHPALLYLNASPTVETWLAVLAAPAVLNAMGGGAIIIMR